MGAPMADATNDLLQKILNNTAVTAQGGGASGTVAVSNLPSTQPVSGTVNVGNLPATQPVSGTVSVGNFPATQPVSGSVSVANLASVLGSSAPKVVSATLNSASSRFLLDVTGLSSAMVHVQGSGVMTLKFGGTADLDGVGSGGRRLWKSGVGSLGTSTIAIDGSVTQVDSEYRVILGGSFLSIDVPSYTSGSVNVTVAADANSPISFIGGPVASTEMDALLGGRLYVASTGFQSVATNQYLNVVGMNPVGSGKLVILLARRFGLSANGTYGGISNPTTATFPATGPTSVTPTNSRTGGVAGVMTFRYNVATTRIDSATPNTNPAGGFLQAYQDSTLQFVRAVPPGQSFGNFIGGAGGGLAAAAVASTTYYWIEQDLY